MFWRAPRQRPDWAAVTVELLVGGSAPPVVLARETAANSPPGYLAAQFCHPSLAGADTAELLLSHAHASAPIVREPLAVARVSEAHLEAARGAAPPARRDAWRTTAVLLYKPDASARGLLKLAAWLAHSRRALGLGSFYFYVNNAVDAVENPALRALLAAPDIVLVEWHPSLSDTGLLDQRLAAPITGGPQTLFDAIQPPMFASFKLRYAALHDYVLVADVDEFALLPGGEALPAAMARCSEGYLFLRLAWTCVGPLSDPPVPADFSLTPPLPVPMRGKYVARGNASGGEFFTHSLLAAGFGDSPCWAGGSGACQYEAPSGTPHWCAAASDAAVYAHLRVWREDATPCQQGLHAAYPYMAGETFDFIPAAAGGETGEALARAMREGASALAALREHNPPGL